MREVADSFPIGIRLVMRSMLDLEAALDDDAGRTLPACKHCVALPSLGLATFVPKPLI